MNYAPLTGAKFVLNINVGASPYAIICRPYGTYLLQSFFTGHQYIKVVRDKIETSIYKTRKFVNVTNLRVLHGWCRKPAEWKVFTPFPFCLRQS